MQLRSAITFLAALATAAAVQAQEVRVSQAYARATMARQPSGAAYLTIENAGNSADKLIAAASPVAKSVEIHTMTMDGNLMKMREVPALELPPTARVEMKPGDGYHLMLLGLRQPLKAGDNFPLMLSFEKAGQLKVDVSVRETGAGHAGMRHGQ